MTLLTTFEDITSISSILQAIVSLASVGLLYSAFALQSKTLREQMKITQSQMALSDIEITRHRKEIMPRFSLSNKKNPYTFPHLSPDGYIKELDFELNDNPVNDFNIEITEIVGYKLYSGQNGIINPPRQLNSKWRMAVQFEYRSIDGLYPLPTGGQLHIGFKLKYRDSRNNLYEQSLYYVPELDPACFNSEPVLLEKSE